MRLREGPNIAVVTQPHRTPTGPLPSSETAAPTLKELAVSAFWISSQSLAWARLPPSAHSQVTHGLQPTLWGPSILPSDPEFPQGNFGLVTRVKS